MACSIQMLQHGSKPATINDIPSKSVGTNMKTSDQRTSEVMLVDKNTVMNSKKQKSKP